MFLRYLVFNNMRKYRIIYDLKVFFFLNYGDKRNCFESKIYYNEYDYY